MSVRMGMFPPPNVFPTPNVGAVPGQMQPAPNPFQPLPPMPLAGPPPPPMGGMPPPPMGGMQPPPMGPMGAGLGAPPSMQIPQQTSNAPRRRQFGDYLENQLSGPSAPVQRSAPQNSFNGPMSSMDIFGGQPMPRPMQRPQFAMRPDSRQSRPLMNGGIVQGYDGGGPVGHEHPHIVYNEGADDGTYTYGQQTDLSGAEYKALQAEKVSQGSNFSGYDPAMGTYYFQGSPMGAADYSAAVQAFRGENTDTAALADSVNVFDPDTNTYTIRNSSTGGTDNYAMGTTYDDSSTEDVVEELPASVAYSKQVQENRAASGLPPNTTSAWELWKKGEHYSQILSAPVNTDTNDAADDTTTTIINNGDGDTETDIINNGNDGTDIINNGTDYVAPAVSTGATTGTYTASGGPANATDAIDYSQFTGDVGNFSNTGEDFALYGPKLNIPAYNSQYISGPSGGLTTTNGPNMTAISGIGALNMPASPVDINVLDWLSDPTYGTFGKPAAFYQEGGAVSRFRAADAASMDSYNKTFADTPGTVANKNKVKEMQEKRRKERALEAAARAADTPTKFYDAFGDSYSTSDDRNAADMADEIAARNAYRDIADTSFSPAGMSFGSGGNFYDPSRENLKNPFTQPIAMSSPSELPFDSERMLNLNDPMSFGLGTGVSGVSLGQSPSLIFPPYLDYRHHEVFTPDVFDPSTIRAETDLQREKRLGLPQYDTLQNDQKDRLLGQYRRGRMSDPTQANQPGRQSLSEFVEGVAKRYGPDVAREMESEVRSDYTFGASPPGTSFGDPGFIPFSTGEIEGSLALQDRMGQLGRRGLDPSLYLSEPGTAVSMAEQMARRKELASNIYTGLGADDPRDLGGSEGYGSLGAPVAATSSPQNQTSQDNALAQLTPRELEMGSMRSPAATASIEALSSGLGGVGGGDPYAPLTDNNVSLVGLKNKISQAEGTNDPGGYDRLLNSGETGTFKNIKLTEMTVGEAIKFAKGDAYRNYSRKVLGRGPGDLPSTPMGKYQITGTTLQGLVDNGIIDLDAPFDAAAQERLGSHLVMNDLYKGKGLRDFKTGKGDGRMSEEDLRIALGKQFEGMEGTTSEELLATAPSQRAGPPTAQESAYIQNLLSNFEFDENGKMLMSDPGLIERVLSSLGSNFTLGQFDLSEYKRKGIQDALDAYKATGEFVYDGGDLVGVRGSDGGVESYGTNIFETNAGDTSSGGSSSSSGSGGPDEVVQNWTIGEDGVVVCNDEGWIYDAETGMCAAPSADANAGSENLSLNIPQARSFEDIMASIQRAPTKPIASLESGGMAGLNRTADNFLRALGG